MSEKKYTRDFVSPCCSYWAKWLQHLVDKPNINGLEVGSFEGRSSCWFCENILTNKTSYMTCIDTFKYKIGTEERFDKNTANLRINKLKGKSSEKLAELILSGKKFDFIYVDGDHNAPQVLEDLCNCWQLLSPGGIMICDDYESLAVDYRKDVLVPVKPAVNAFILCYRHKIEKYEITPPFKERDTRKQAVIWKKKDTMNTKYVLFNNNEGSTGHYYHFFYAVYLPLTAYLLNNPLEEIYLRGCDKMTKHLYNHPFVLEKKIKLNVVRKKDLIKEKRLQKIQGIDILYEKQKEFFNIHSNIKDYFNKTYELLDIVQKNILLIERPFNDPRRTITNIKEIENILKLNYNNVIRVTLEDLSIKEQAQMFASSKIVIAQHGAGLSNMYFCRPDTFLLEIGSNHRKDFANICELLNFNYSAWNPNPTSDRNDRLEIDVKILLEKLNEIKDAASLKKN